MHKILSQRANCSLNLPSHRGSLLPGEVGHYSLEKWKNYQSLLIPTLLLVGMEGFSMETNHIVGCRICVAFEYHINSLWLK